MSPQPKSPPENPVDKRSRIAHGLGRVVLAVPVEGGDVWRYSMPLAEQLPRWSGDCSYRKVLG